MSFSSLNQYVDINRTEMQIKTLTARGSFHFPETGRNNKIDLVSAIGKMIKGKIY